MTVARPALFHPEVPPPGFESNLVSFWRERPIINPRLQLFHTNGAPGEGSVDASRSWAERRGGNTLPHLQIDRRTRAALLLPTNRKGIGNFQVADWSLVFETADSGTNTDPQISEYTDFQIEKCAVAAAYYHILHGIPLRYPDTWDGAGTGSHTEPFGFDKWTNSPGKICPGRRKKDQLREVILPLARRIVADWTAPPEPNPPPQPQENKVLVIGRYEGSYYVGDGVQSRRLRGPGDTNDVIRLFGAKDRATGDQLSDVLGVGNITEDEYRDLGVPVRTG